MPETVCRKKIKGKNPRLGLETKINLNYIPKINWIFPARGVGQETKPGKIDPTLKSPTVRGSTKRGS